ncbi:unnamed protein product [Linum trigynum]|uniref:Uncharacterized protein n=1 Tax=Linum trigynum TaxID=586398 RepID=A0AAV2FYU1_9ROSI
MRKICSGMMISTPRTISKLDLMKPSSKIASRMCSSYFLSLGLCFCSKSPILPLAARNWVKTRKSRLTRAGPHGRVAYPVARVSQNDAFHLVQFSGFSHGQSGMAVCDFHLPVFALGKTRTAKPLLHTAVCVVRAGRVCSRTISHGQKYELHGRVICGCARVASFVTCLAPDLRPIDPKLAPEPTFTY